MTSIISSPGDKKTIAEALAKNQNPLTGLERWQMCKHHLVLPPHQYDYHPQDTQPVDYRDNFSCQRDQIIWITQGYLDVTSSVDPSFAAKLRGKKVTSQILPGERISTDIVRLHPGGFDDTPSVRQALNEICAQCPFFEAVV